MRRWVSSAARRRGSSSAGGLHVDEGGDQLQAVGDAVVDLAQQRLEPLVAGAQLLLGLLLAAAAAPARWPARRRCASRSKKSSPIVLTHIVDGAGLQRRDGDAALVGSGDVDDRRRIGQLAAIAASVASPSWPGM